MFSTHNGQQAQTTPSFRPIILCGVKGLYLGDRTCFLEIYFSQLLVGPPREHNPEVFLRGSSWSRILF